MAEGLGLIFSILFSCVCLLFFFTGSRFLFPGIVERTRRTADLMPGRAFIVGFVNLLFFGAIASGFAAISDGLGAGIFVLPAILIIGLLTIGLFLGLVGIVALLGERLMPGESRRRQTIWGGVILILGSLTPFIGWFFFFPYIGGIGLGSFLLGWFRRVQVGARGDSNEMDSP